MGMRQTIQRLGRAGRLRRAVPALAVLTFGLAAEARGLVAIHQETAVEAGGGAALAARHQPLLDREQQALARWPLGHRSQPWVDQDPEVPQRIDAQVGEPLLCVEHAPVPLGEQIVEIADDPPARAVRQVRGELSHADGVQDEQIRIHGLHGGPDAAADVRLRYGANNLELEVTNTGRGAWLDRPGLGMLGMRERAAASGGTLEVGPRARGVG